MKLLNVDTREEALSKLLTVSKDYSLKKEWVPLDRALDRVLAEDAKTKADIPKFRRSTVDGYAVLAKDTAGAGESLPVLLKVVGEVSIGTEVTEKIQSGEAIYVPTGGMLPEFADAVVMVEYCETFGEEIAVYDSVSSGRNVVERGDDFKEGECFLKKGTLLRPQEIGALASAGYATVLVYVPFFVTIISTGDELVPVSIEPAPGQIRDINTYALLAKAKNQGMQIRRTLVLKDEEALLTNSLKEALLDSDLVLISGGSSQGKQDITMQVMQEVCKPGVFTHGLALKPGKPTITGFDETSSTFVFGLPGHPVAAMLVFELLVCPLYRSLYGMSEIIPLLAFMKTNFACAGGKETCLPVSLQREGEKIIAEPILGRSGMISTLTKADGYVLFSKDKEGIQAGEMVEVYMR